MSTVDDADAAGPLLEDVIVQEQGVVVGQPLLDGVEEGAAAGLQVVGVAELVGVEARLGVDREDGPVGVVDDDKLARRLRTPALLMYSPADVRMNT